MKRFVIALVILGLVLGTGTALNVHFERTVNVMVGELEKMITQAQQGKSETLTASVQSFAKYWDKNSSFLHMVVIHRGMDEAEQNVMQMERILQTTDKEEFILLCLQTKAQLTNIAKSERVLAENVF